MVLKTNHKFKRLVSLVRAFSYSNTEGAAQNSEIKNRGGVKGQAHSYHFLIVFGAVHPQMYGVIDRVQGQDSWILAKFFLCVSRSINSQKKKERGHYPAILTKQAWSIKDLAHGFWGNLSCGTQRVVPNRQDSSILPARVANHSAGFDSSCSPTELAI